MEDCCFKGNEVSYWNIEQLHMPQQELLQVHYFFTDIFELDLICWSQVVNHRCSLSKDSRRLLMIYMQNPESGSLAKLWWLGISVLDQIGSQESSLTKMDHYLTLDLRTASLKNTKLRVSSISQTGWNQIIWSNQTILLQALIQVYQ